MIHIVINSILGEDKVKSLKEKPDGKDETLDDGWLDLTYDRFNLPKC